MKKIIVIILIIALLIILLAVVVYKLTGEPLISSFPVGYKSGHVIVYQYTCADLCPQYGYWSKKFAGEISETECLQIGGKPEYVTYAGVVEHGYNGCTPE
jgi:hypothetical protein